MNTMHSSISHIIPYLLVATLYMVVALDFWRVANKAGALGEQDSPFQLHSSIITIALALHGYLLYLDMYALHAVNFGIYYALSAIMWLTVLIYWLAELRYNLHSLQALVLPPSAFCVLLPALTIKDHYIDPQGLSLFSAHIVLAIVGYSLFTFAAMHACLMALAERALHQKNTWLKLPSLPPLMVMDNILFQVIGAGFALLTITVLSGVLFSEQIFNKPLVFNHKTVFSIAAWLIYAWLLYGRVKFGWRGKIAVRWSLVGFLLLLLAYVGSRFVLQVILNR